MFPGRWKNWATWMEYFFEFHNPSKIQLTIRWVLLLVFAFLGIFVNVSSDCTLLKGLQEVSKLDTIASICLKTSSWSFLKILANYTNQTHSRGQTSLSLHLHLISLKRVSEGYRHNFMMQYWIQVVVSKSLTFSKHPFLANLNFNFRSASPILN